MQKELLRAQRTLLARGSTLALVTLSLGLVAWTGIHAAHVYPGFLAHARHTQEDASLTYSRNCAGVIPSSQFVDCGNLASERDTNVFARAADQTLAHLADDLNVLRWIGCSGNGGWCSHILAILFSWAYVLLPAVCAVLLFYLYTLARTMDSYYNVQHVKAQSRLAQQYNPYAAMALNVMKET